MARAGKLLLHQAYGTIAVDSCEAVDCGTVFDLASLTKPLATTLAAMDLIKEGRIGLDQPIGRLIPQIAATSKADITVRHLLAHRSGLPAWRPYFRKLRRLPPPERRWALREMIAGQELETPPGTRTCYSDLGFILLAWVLEIASGRRLDRLVEDRFYRPLGVERDLFFIDLSRPLPERRFAATEKCAWRGKLLQGEVHDDNAHVAGGIEGHAGLFGTARGIWKLLTAMLECFKAGQPSGPFVPELVDQFFAPQAGGRSLGFDRITAGASSSGSFFSANTIGHLGFTGTSFWVDLDREIMVILLTNRVNPSRDNDRIRSFRPVLHDEIMKLLLGNG